MEDSRAVHFVVIDEKLPNWQVKTFSMQRRDPGVHDLSTIALVRRKGPQNFSVRKFVWHLIKVV